MWKKVLWTILLVVIVIIGSGYWFFGLVEKHPDIAALKATQPDQLEYLKHAVDIKRGRILIVVTSTNKMGDTDKYTGYELTELSRAYYIFEVNGFAVDIASPLGGRPPVVIDNDDMGELDYAFLNDELAQNKVRHSLALSTVDPDNYAAVYFVGGKGAMFDFPDNQAIQQLVQNYAEQGKVIGAVCHGPAALVNVSLSNGAPMLQGREVVSFTNAEELFLIPEAATIFPFLLESKLQQQGARFSGGPNYLEQVVVDNKLVTGQNPWSVWLLAESMIQALGYEPVLRQLDRQEHSVKLLQIYHDYGFEMAATELNLMLNSAKQYPDRNLILMHGIVGVMQGDFGKAIDLVRLAHRVKNWSSS
ncbi:type 1 glutamine amidotransferase domain-containing protein [Paraglaciecola hydrolytica]|uniref:Glutamine amidotransferase n=1 Tax=Paraglaciecola hydrolytica TaxID=1799789 RepID=A0A136A058_9ALTE|nr:type 1 glutamine amidotransferase domain-containing protein [Paraglaciecola hydrolytica]KXI28638.1 glutamine amidotransferase [Paraglaciecola hydrolytica]